MEQSDKYPRYWRALLVPQGWLWLGQLKPDVQAGGWHGGTGMVRQ